MTSLPQDRPDWKHEPDEPCPICGLAWSEHTPQTRVIHLKSVPQP